MLELVSDGIYLAGGQPVPRAEAPDSFSSPAEARKRTMTHAILSAHNSSEDPSHLRITFDALTSH